MDIIVGVLIALGDGEFSREGGGGGRGSELNIEDHIVNELELPHRRLKK